MANWKDVAELIAPYAPTAGKFLGGMSGLPFGSAIGEKIGETIAVAFGLPPSATPSEVAATIEVTPANEVTARLQAVEASAVAKWNAMAEIAKSDDAARVEQSKVINETQRAEIAAGVSPWHWRHLIGYLVLLYGLVQVGGIVVCGVLITFAGRDPQVTVTVFSTLWNATTTFTFGLFGLLGFIASDSNKLKAIAMTGEQPPTILDKVKAVVAPAAKPVKK